LDGKTHLLKIGARRSDLARLQAYQVGEALKTFRPNLEIQYLFKESLGDQNQNDPLWKMPTRGVFTEDFVSDLKEGRTDLVVHSWKDLPTEPREGLSLAATPSRADPRDLLFVRKGSVGKKELMLLTSSPRRTFATDMALKRLLPFPTSKIETKPVRGNITTRLKKLAAGDGDGLFMAKAALDRFLGKSVLQEDFSTARNEMRALLENFYFMVLPLSYFPTAPAQGALALEIRADRNDLRELLSPIHDSDTYACVEKERLHFSAFGGGCHQKIGITVVKHPRLGTIEFFHGHPDGQSSRRTIKIESTLEEDRSGLPHWPEQPIFVRRSFSEIKNPGGALFVSRAEALPSTWQVKPDQLVWTAGVRTWQKLAERGIWVNGSSDGLGEAIPELNALIGTPVSWTKLTHDQSGNDRLFPCLRTYHLEPASSSRPPLLPSYFWTSESLFRWAIEKRPEIRDAQHAAGPGYTTEAIEKELGRSIDVYYNYGHWKTGDATDES
jgi:hydroxymethylbilane synthase